MDHITRQQVTEAADMMNGWIMELHQGVAQVTFQGQAGAWQLLGFSEQGQFAHLLQDGMETAREFLLGDGFTVLDVARWTVEVALQWNAAAAQGRAS